MLASVALGTLRHPDMQSPGGLLKDLNAALHGQTGGGFVTCCAALLRHDGQLTVANAGHPSPYVDGRELAVEAGLPLGIVADATYEEAVSHGSSITLISDGVLEAENAQRELFGFERSLEISKRSAQEIAEAARAWGQTDDITVVTIRRRS
jgi:serine phosphatase RsbU (regulator of sigma subunit)